jgi:hypothetical protein
MIVLFLLPSATAQHRVYSSSSSDQDQDQVYQESGGLKYAAWCAVNLYEFEDLLIFCSLIRCN